MLFTFPFGDFAALFFGGAAGAVEEDGGVEFEFFGEGFAGGSAFWVFLVQGGGNACGASPFGEAGYVEPVLVGPLFEGDLVSHLHGLAALGPVAIEIDLAAVDGFGREGSRLVEPGGPEPAVEPDRMTGFWHIIKHSADINLGGRSSPRI